MAISVKDVLTRAKIILQDGDSVRWPLPELSLWVLDGAKEIALFQPSATATTVVLEMVLGTRQTVPAAYQSMLSAVRNMTEDGTVGGKAIKIASREMLDAQSENWHDPAKHPFRAVVRNVVLNAMDPQTYYVYPGNDASGMIEAVLSIIPTLTGTPTDPDELDDYAAVTVPLIPVWLSALVDYIMYRSYSKDMQIQGAAERAAAHYNQFKGAITARADANTAAATPRS